MAKRAVAGTLEAGTLEAALEVARREAKAANVTVNWWAYCRATGADLARETHARGSGARFIAWIAARRQEAARTRPDLVTRDGVVHDLEGWPRYLVACAVARAVEAMTARPAGGAPSGSAS